MVALEAGRGLRGHGVASWRDDALRRCWGCGSADPVVLVVGRLAAEKNLDLAIRAFEALALRAPAAKLVFVGDGPRREELEKLCPHARFAGMREGADLAAHYASGDLFLFPSLTETFGNVLLEALASGLVTVSFKYAASAANV